MEGDKNPPEVALVILGLGHMGIRGLLLTNWLREYLRRNHKIDIAFQAKRKASWV